MVKSFKFCPMVFLAVMALILSACGEEAKVKKKGTAPYLFGNSAAGPNTLSVSGANVFTVPITVSADTYVTGVGVFVITAGLDFTLGIYDDNAGVANNLLVSGGPVTSVDGDTFASVTPTFIPAGNYWLAQQTALGDNFTYYAETFTGRVNWMGVPAGDPMPATFAVTSFLNGDLPSVYILVDDTP